MGEGVVRGEEREGKWFRCERGHALGRYGTRKELCGVAARLLTGGQMNMFANKEGGE